MQLGHYLGSGPPANVANRYLVLLAAILVLLIGETIASQPPPPLPEPVRVDRYGDFGEASNPYGAGAGFGGSAAAGAFSDQQPLPAPTSVVLPVSPRSLNGGNRGFPPESLTVNQRLP